MRHVTNRAAMHRRRPLSTFCRTGCMAAVLLATSGCQHCGWWGRRCEDIPPGAVPAPVGSYNGQWQQSQEARADEDFLVFHQYEWLGESDQLSPFGQRHVERLVERVPPTARPIVIEDSGDPERDQSRVVMMRATLSRNESAWAECPVVVGRSQAEPLYGFEAPRISNGFLGGGSGGGQGGGGFGGGAGGGGFGGGAGGGGLGGGIQ